MRNHYFSYNAIFNESTLKKKMAKNSNRGKAKQPKNGEPVGRQQHRKQPARKEPIRGGRLEVDTEERQAASISNASAARPIPQGSGSARRGRESLPRRANLIASNQSIPASSRITTAAPNIHASNRAQPSVGNMQSGGAGNVSATAGRRNPPSQRQSIQPTRGRTRIESDTSNDDEEEIPEEEIPEEERPEAEDLARRPENIAVLNERVAAYFVDYNPITRTRKCSRCNRILRILRRGHRTSRGQKQ